jgi:hypothetical protein
VGMARLASRSSSGLGAILDALRATKIPLSLGRNSPPASSARPSTCLSACMIAFSVDQVTTADLPLHAVSAVGETFPLHSSEKGKAMLATLPDPFIETIIGRSSPARMDKAITTLPALLGQLAGIRSWHSPRPARAHDCICAGARVSVDLIPGRDQ